MPDVIFSVTGKVVHGEKVGRTIGFPTANLDVTLSEADLKLGVYAGHCSFSDSTDAKTYNCVAYFGPRVIFGETKNNFEVYILDLSQEIYDQELRVDLLFFVRDPLPFSSLSDLQTQLKEDILSSQQLLATVN